jgi:xylulokinase
MFLGIDIGTSSVKAVLVDDSGTVAGQATAPLTVSRPHSGWSEQNPVDWWTATNRTVTALESQRRRQVRAIGLSGQMHGATLLDAADRPLRPAILWNDGRSAAQCAALERAVPASRQITGNLAMPGFTAPKLLWVKQHEPDAFAATRCVLLPKDYVRLCMTGAKATDLSDAAGTLWLDVAKRAWSVEMLAATGLTQNQMPRLHEGCEVTGALRAPTSLRRGAWSRSWSQRAAVIMPPALLASVSSTRATRCWRSARPACCSLPAKHFGPIRSAPCTRSAMPFRSAGTR